MSVLQLKIRDMTLDDLEEVYQIDQLSFSLPWPKKSYQYEVADNQFSTCWVATLGPRHAASNTDPSLSPVNDGEVIVGMAVVWLVVDEAHIATIAVHPEFRGLGFGKEMLAAILEDSRKRGMVTATLEVRASNHIAQAMYKDFGFDVLGVRQKYYKDNQEDALIMTADLRRTPLSP